MLRLNKVDRFTLADEALGLVCDQQPDHPIGARAGVLSSQWKHELVKHSAFTHEQ